MIELKNVSVVKNGNTILNGINLTINKGDKILIHGESGSGKSTLLKSILFFESFTGSIQLRNRLIDHSNISHFRQQFAYLGQNLPFFGENVEDFIRHPFSFRSNREKIFHINRMISLLGSLNFDMDILKKNFSDLSGGEKQRIAITQVMMLEKPIYILDEITSALDPRNIKNVVKTLTNNPMRTLIVTSHDPYWNNYANQKINMSKGKIAGIER